MRHGQNYPTSMTASDFPDWNDISCSDLADTYLCYHCDTEYDEWKSQPITLTGNTYCPECAATHLTCAFGCGKVVSDETIKEHGEPVLRGPVIYNGEVTMMLGHVDCEIEFDKTHQWLHPKGQTFPEYKPL